MNTHEYFHEIQQFSRLLTKQLNEQLAPYKMFTSQWAIIYLLKKNGRSLPSQLSEYLKVEKSTITRTLSRMSNEGWIQKVTSLKDKREKAVELTEKALILYPVWEKIVNNFEQSILAHVGKEHEQNLLNAIREFSQAIMKGQTS
jgi:MarR family transcriptional regulator for hemolysin